MRPGVALAERESEREVYRGSDAEDRPLHELVRIDESGDRGAEDQDLEPQSSRVDGRVLGLGRDPPPPDERDRERRRHRQDPAQDTVVLAPTPVRDRCESRKLEEEAKPVVRRSHHLILYRRQGSRGKPGFPRAMGRVGIEPTTLGLRVPCSTS